MKSRFSGKDYSVSLIELKKIVVMDSNEESESFKKYITELISMRTGTKHTLKNIADTAKIARNNLTRFPVQRHEYISAVATAFSLSLEETKHLYERCGLCISLQNKYDLKYIRKIINPKDIDSLPSYINRKSHVDCILELIQKHKYDSTTDFGIKITAFKRMIKDIPDFYIISFEEKEEYIHELLKIIEFRAKKNNWIIRIPDYVSSPNEKSRKRETAFEIAYVCNFDLEETEQLFNSFGFTLCPQYIKFDAYVIWLQNTAPESSDFFYLYKSVCSDIDEVTYGDFHRKDVCIERLEKSLSINCFSKEDIISILSIEKEL